MGCSGSKYQALSAENISKSDGATGTSDAPATSGDALTPQKPATTSHAYTPSTPATPGSPEPAIGPPPWGPGSRNPSMQPQFEPPLAENFGDDDNVEMEMVSENLEEKFPPWRQNDNFSPAAGGRTANLRGKQESFQPPVSFPLGAPVPATSSSAHAPPERKVLETRTTFENTVIIFDWDDTLLCSSALHCCLPNQFVELEEIVETVLGTAMSLGQTMIVTNAMESWIQETAKRFMPKLVPTLERMLIVYARKNWERLWPGDTFAWKRECFREVLNDKLGCDLNLLVLGDSLSEIRAAEALADFLGTSALVKTVKFKALPSPTDLLGQLRTVGPELSRLVEERHSTSKELYQDVAPGGLFSGGVFQGAPTWQLLDAVPNEMFAPPPSLFAQWTGPPPASPVSPAPNLTQITI